MKKYTPWQRPKHPLEDKVRRWYENNGFFDSARATSDIIRYLDKRGHSIPTLLHRMNNWKPDYTKSKRNFYNEYQDELKYGIMIKY